MVDETSQGEARRLDELRVLAAETAALRAAKSEHERYLVAQEKHAAVRRAAPNPRDWHVGWRFARWLCSVALLTRVSIACSPPLWVCRYRSWIGRRRRPASPSKVGTRA